MCTHEFLDASGELHSFICAKQVITYRGSFVEPLELHRFPFDCQWIHARLESEQDKDVQLVQDSQDYPPKDLNWRSKEFNPGRWKAGFEVDPEVDGSAKKMRIVFGVQSFRISRSYVTRVLVVMFLTLVVSFSIFSMDPQEFLGDRLALVFTMMLTAAAYSNVVGSMLPPLGYSTFIDNYIFFVFNAYTVLTMQISFVAMVATSSESDIPFPALAALGILDDFQQADYHQADHICFVMDVVLFCLIHFFLIAWVYLYIFPEEAKKDFELDEVAEGEGVLDAQSDGYDDASANSDGATSIDGHDQTGLSLLRCSRGYARSSNG